MQKQSRGNYLYHYTTLENLYKMWRSDSLKPAPQAKSDGREAICLTRNPNMHLRWAEKPIRLTLDVSKMRGALESFKHPSEKQDYSYEAEERCYKEIPKFIRYLVRVDFNLFSLGDRNPSLINRLRMDLDTFNIPYSVTDANKALIPPEEVRQGKEPIFDRFLDENFYNLNWALKENVSLISLDGLSNCQRVLESTVSELEGFEMGLDEVEDTTELPIDPEELEQLQKYVFSKIEPYLLLFGELEHFYKEILRYLSPYARDPYFTKVEDGVKRLQQFKFGQTLKQLDTELGYLIQVYLGEKDYQRDGYRNYPTLRGRLTAIKDMLQQFATYIRDIRFITQAKRYLVQLKTNVENKELRRQGLKQAKVVRRKNRYFVTDSKGKVLPSNPEGGHTSEENAKKQLRAIHWSKGASYCPQCDAT